jgi:sugar phosphate isomerase/epimerase
MIVACSTVSFKKDIAGALADIGRLEFTHADLIAIPGFRQTYPERMAADPAGQARELATALSRAGVKPATFNVNVPDFTDRTPEAIERRDREWTGLARVMKALGVKIASFYPGYLKQGEPWHRALDASAATAAEMLQAAEKHGVEFLIEAHYDTPVCSPEQVGALLSSVPGVRFVYDPSHFAMLGLGLGERKAVLDRSSHIHIRDAAPEKMYVKCGIGTVDFSGLMAALRERGYAGFVSLECLPTDDWNVEEDVAALKRLMDGLNRA